MQIQILLAALFFFGSLQRAGSQEVRTPGPCKSESAIYEYKLRGEIRFLILWLGRNNVGGGHISFRRNPGVSANS